MKCGGFLILSILVASVSASKGSNVIVVQLSDAITSTHGAGGVSRFSSVMKTILADGGQRADVFAVGKSTIVVGIPNKLIDESIIRFILKSSHLVSTYVVIHTFLVMRSRVTTDGHTYSRSTLDSD